MPLPPQSRPQLLLVDASRLECAVLKQVLERDDWCVWIAHDGKEALRLMAENKVDIAVLALDLDDMSGLQLCLRLREHSRALPVLFLSEGEEWLRRLGLRLPGTWWLPKPVHFQSLCQLLREAAPHIAGLKEIQRASASCVNRPSPSFGAGWMPSTAQSKL
jgi:DNA-binding response OmpR family regulator